MRITLRAYGAIPVLRTDDTTFVPYMWELGQGITVYRPTKTRPVILRVEMPLYLNPADESEPNSFCMKPVAYDWDSVFTVKGMRNLAETCASYQADTYVTVTQIEEYTARVVPDILARKMTDAEIQVDGNLDVFSQLKVAHDEEFSLDYIRNHVILPAVEKLMEVLLNDADTDLDVGQETAYQASRTAFDMTSSKHGVIFDICKAYIMRRAGFRG